MSIVRSRNVSILAFFFTVGFFIEYLPLLRRVHIPYDLEQFHYPLADYAFQALRQGRFPQWDPTIYSGLSYVANFQSGIFYPPTWLAFVFSLGHRRLAYQAMEDLALAHVWLAFVLCYLWLHQTRKLHWLAAVLGSGVFAFSGYMVGELQHLGLVCGYAWMPLGFAGIDEAGQLRGGKWRPLWKLALASAMCLLAGYPLTWVAFAVSMIAYACFRSGGLQLTALAAGALLVSLFFSAVQLLPGLQATRLRAPDFKYGRASGLKDPRYYLSYAIPNYFQFGREDDYSKDPNRDFLYLGAAGLTGCALLAARRRFLDLRPPFAVLIVSLIFATNPFDMVGAAIEDSFFAQIIGDYYFLAGLTAAVAPLAAAGLDFVLKRKSAPLPVWLAGAVVSLAIAWSIHLLMVWGRQSGFAIRWLSGLDTLVAILLCGALLRVFTGSVGRMRSCAALGLILLAASEYKAFGTNRRFNAAPGPVGADFLAASFPGLPSETYALLRRHSNYRLAIDNATGPLPLDLRHGYLTTPQGFDPLLPARYKKLIDGMGGFRTNREFDVVPENEPALRLLGVGYFITSESGPLYPRLVRNPRFRLIQPSNGYYKVFQYLDARPAFGWDEPAPDQVAEATIWEPESRVFRVQSARPGLFRLSEQFFPGWMASVDGASVEIQACHEAFQCVSLQPGEHVVAFRYRSFALLAGAAISILSILLALAALRWLHQPPQAN